MKRLPIPGRLNLAIIALQLTAWAAIVLGVAAASAWWHVVLLTLAMMLVGNSMYAMMHEAQHRILHPRRAVNDALGSLLGLFFPAPFHLLRQGHLGHHLRNRSDDEAFDYYFEGDNVAWKWLQLYGILIGGFWLTVAGSTLLVVIWPRLLQRKHFDFDRPSAAFMDSLNPAYFPLIRGEACLAIVLHATVIWALGINPVVYGLVYLGFGWSWSAMQYVHHFGTPRDVREGSRNLWIFAPIDYLWLHHNWHKTHHHHPTVPWIYLPALARREESRREFLPWHYLRMWRGPRYTDIRVENRYAGRIIR